MTGTKLVLVLTLVVPTASAQYRAGFAGGFGRAASPVIVRPPLINSRGFGVLERTGRGFVRGRFAHGQGYGWPYIPMWDYNVPQPYYDDDSAPAYPQYPSVGDVVIVKRTSEIARPPKPASSVIHEYNFETQSITRTGERPSFTIVLKDGSTRAAAASWVSGGRLHYLDLQSRQHALSPDLIDRDATERANEAKNIRLELPPG